MKKRWEACASILILLTLVLLCVVVITGTLLLPKSSTIASTEYLSITTGKRAQDTSLDSSNVSYSWGFPITLNETMSFVNVDIGSFQIAFAKGAAGYDVISDNGTIVVEEQQFEIQRQLNKTQWRMAGDVTGVSWEKISDYEYQVIRHYDNYGGVTSNVTYNLKAYEPVKVTFTINSGVSNTYRIAWFLDGIARTGYIETGTSCIFYDTDVEDIEIDWEDVYLSFGAITTYEVTTSAAGRKIQLYFNVGDVLAGDVAVVDPSIKSKIKTDRDKLLALYSLSEQMRLEHNRVGKIASADFETYRDKWTQYSKIFKEKQLFLAREMLKLEEAIIDANYTEEEWPALSLPEQEDTKLILLGDRITEALKPTIATSSALDGLKAVDFYSLDGTYVDPYEDFTTYTETDTGPGGSCTVTTNRVVVVNNGVESEVKVVGDYGASHFSGDYSHDIDAIYTAGGSYEYGGIYAITNTNGYKDTMSAAFQVYRDAGARFYIDNLSGRTYTPISVSTQYYLTVARASTTGTLYTYSNSNRTTLVSGSPISLTTATTAWRYIIVGYTHSNGHYSNVNWQIDNLDLHEAAPEPSIAVSPSSKAFGVLLHGQTYWSNNTTLGYSPSWPLSSGNCYGYLTNDGSVAGVVTAKATNFTGNNTLTIGDAAPGSTNLRMSLFKAGDGSTDNVTLITTDRTFLSSMASGNVTYFEIKLEWITSYEVDPNLKTSTIIYTISAL